MKKTLKKILIILASLIIFIVGVGVLFLYSWYDPYPNEEYVCTYRKVRKINNNESLYRERCNIPNVYACRPLTSYYKINSTKNKIKIDVNSKTKYNIEFVYQRKDLLDDTSIDEIIECYLDNDCELNNDNSGGC